MIYLDVEKEQQGKSRKRIQCYAEKIAAMKKEKEAGDNVGTQGFCRERVKGY